MILTRFPFPEELEWFDIGHRNAYIASLPDEGLWYYIGVHGLGALLAGLIASLIPKKNRFTIGLIAALSIFVYVVIDGTRLTYPTWYHYADPAISALLGILGSYIGSRRAV